MLPVTSYTWLFCFYTRCLQLGLLYRRSKYHGFDYYICLRKEPDCAFSFFNKENLQAEPRIVLEAGFTQTDEGLEEDARQWLEYGMAAKLVITVKVYEGKINDEHSPGFQDRICNLIRRFGNERGREKLPDGDTDQDQLPEMEARAGIRGALNKHDWVGPITAECIVWERFGTGKRRRASVVSPRLFFNTNIC